MLNHIAKVKRALHELQRGRCIVLTDHPDRENEGDLVCAAQDVSPELISFILQYSSGIICLALPTEQVKRLNLDYMVPPHHNSSARHTPFTVSIDAAHGITTGVSAADRAHTILTAIKTTARAADLVTPGHVFPLHAADGGVLVRPGHTEGSLDLVRLAGCQPAALLCEIMNSDGTMARGPELIEFARQHNLVILSIDDLIAYRRTKENLLDATASASLDLDHYGRFIIKVFTEHHKQQEHVVLINDTYDPDEPVLVRVHSACFTGDVLHSLRCDCYPQLHWSLQEISNHGGILIYLQQEGRGLGLGNKIKAYALQEEGIDTVDANEQLGLAIDAREYYVAANILRNHSINKVQLLTNNPDKVAALQYYGIGVVMMKTLPLFSNKHNKHYLLTKKHKLKHCLDL